MSDNAIARADVTIINDMGEEYDGEIVIRQDDLGRSFWIEDGSGNGWSVSLAEAKALIERAEAI